MGTSPIDEPPRWVPSGNPINLGGFLRVAPPIPLNKEGFSEGGVTFTDPQRSWDSCDKGVRRLGIPRLGTWRKQKQGLYEKVMWPPMALRIGLLRSSALQSDGHIKPVTLRCRTPGETNPKGHWGPNYLLRKTLLFSSLNGGAYVPVSACHPDLLISCVLYGVCLAVFGGLLVS